MGRGVAGEAARNCNFFLERANHISIRNSQQGHALAAIRSLREAARKYAGLNNFPSDCLFSDDEVKAHDGIRQQEMAKAQAPQLAMAGVNAARTLSQTEVPGGNALGALMGGMGGS